MFSYLEAFDYQEQHPQGRALVVVQQQLAFSQYLFEKGYLKVELPAQKLERSLV